MSLVQRYIALRLLNASLIAFGLCFLLVFLIDFVELFRQSGAQSDATMGNVAAVSFLRVPSLIEQAAPFVMLFAALSTLSNLNRRSELVVARAAGLSAWQFLFPCVVVALAFGIAMICVFNPVAANLKDRSDKIAAEKLGSGYSNLLGGENRALAIRQGGPDGESILTAKNTLSQGQVLLDVTVFVLDENGGFLERIDAEQAEYKTDRWEITNGTFLEVGSPPRPFETYLLWTTLSLDELRQSLGEASSISFWSLPETIRQLDSAGLPTHRFEINFQVLLSQPLTMVIMIILSALVSLRSARFGGAGRMIVVGVVMGFMLYVIFEIIEDLGAIGLVAPVLAAWVPLIVALFMGITILLFREDG